MVSTFNYIALVNLIAQNFALVVGMNSVMTLARELAILLSEALDRVVDGSQIDLKGTMEAMLITEKAIDQLHQRILTGGFESNQEEIDFFKTIQPNFYGALLFERLTIKMIFPQLPDPIGDITTLKELEKKKFDNYLSRHQEFYRYYRLGFTYLDATYFLRSSTEANILFDEEDMLVDRRLFTRVSAAKRTGDADTQGF